MKWFLVIPISVLSILLISVAIDQLGQLGNIIMKCIGLFGLFSVGLIVRKQSVR
ncbi:hypothetical protein [Bacillus sp. PS06]|uniref:hypothetical protein n=1 Tax=Bacillus sp. PS06 TaxID=2764176 RepID=UPI00177D07FE|nr:hypothetical protein [Bacillus sp. PS06]MBD8067835.1 hypothetical protein [Bacillus sp. PS06]